MIRSITEARVRQVAGQAKARAVVDRQYFQQRANERRVAEFDTIQCEANAPRFFPHTYDHMNGTIK